MKCCTHCTGVATATARLRAYSTHYIGELTQIDMSAVIKLAVQLVNGI